MTIAQFANRFQVEDGIGAIFGRRKGKKSHRRRRFQSKEIFLARRKDVVRLEPIVDLP